MSDAARPSKPSINLTRLADAGQIAEESNNHGQEYAQHFRAFEALRIVGLHKPKGSRDQEGN